MKKKKIKVDTEEKLVSIFGIEQELDHFYNMDISIEMAGSVANEVRNDMDRKILKLGELKRDIKSKEETSSN